MFLDEDRNRIGSVHDLKALLVCTSSFWVGHEVEARLNLKAKKMRTIGRVLWCIRSFPSDEKRMRLYQVKTVLVIFNF